MESGSEQTFDGLTVASYGNRSQGSTPILPKQPPVLLELPDGESEESWEKHDVKPGDRHGKGFVHVLDQERFHVDGQDEQDRQEDFVGDGHDGEVFDGVKCRLDEQVDIDSNQERDHGPEEAEDGFGDERQEVLLAVESEPFVDGIEKPFECEQHAAKQLDDPIDGDDNPAQSDQIPETSDGFEEQFLEVSPQARVHHGAQDDRLAGDTQVRA